MKRDPLLWAALVAVLVVLASAEYQLAVACGFGQYVAAGVPAALDVYALAALRARRDVFAVVLTLIGVNAASHLVQVGLLPVSVTLVVAVSAVAPLVLWRVHRLSEHQPEPQPEPSSATAEPAPELAEPITVERAPEPVDAPPVGPVLGPWTPVAELAGGTTGTVLDLRLPEGYTLTGTPAGAEAEPTPEPVPPAGTGAADLVTEDTANTTFAKRVDTVRAWLHTEPDLTGTDIGTRLGVSDSYGRRVLRAARDDS
ncbi:hypothetical protein [Streptomyces sp. A012304]|uniref:hypothetical protein n=1 Tax=Streptomyces sp. A012304 TaxID=375446 RepID=UPI002230B7EC|nr:hypothetical protein [Streptomyces sp. A012304]GKQ37016.1 hypothetical protein ALMP_35550 [Streptomyces sp. A012304]